MAVCTKMRGYYKRKKKPIFRRIYKYTQRLSINIPEALLYIFIFNRNPIIANVQY
jgi:hypothetical protein